MSSDKDKRVSVNTDPNLTVPEKLELPGMGDVIDMKLGSNSITMSEYLFNVVKEIIVSERDWHLDRLAFLQQKVIDLKKQGFEI